MGEDILDGSIPQFSSPVQIPHPMQEGSDRLHLGEHSSDSMVENKTECVLITCKSRA